MVDNVNVILGTWDKQILKFSATMMGNLNAFLGIWDNVIFKQP